MSEFPSILFITGKPGVGKKGQELIYLACHPNRLQYQVIVCSHSVDIVGL